jgi:hypothetical protein
MASCRWIARRVKSFFGKSVMSAAIGNFAWGRFRDFDEDRHQSRQAIVWRG